MDPSCRWCSAGLEHCHGTLVHHAVGAAALECTESDCALPEIVHAFAIDCSATGCTCTVAVIEAFAVTGTG